MNLLKPITSFIDKKDYLAPYVEDESAKKAATKLWSTIVSGDLVLWGLMFLITVSVCYYYFFPFNEKPGRHYHPKWWGLFYIVVLLLVFLSTFIGCWCIAKNPGFDIGLLLKVSAINMFYAAILYFVISIGFIKTGKSNAYPWI